MLRADLIGTTSNLTAELQGEHGLYLEGIPVDGGILKYDAATKRVYVVAIDDAMSDTSENVVQNKVIKQYVDQNSGAIATISVNGVEQEIVNKNVNISVPTATSGLENNGDGESPFATEAYVEQNGGKIDSISVNGVEQTIDENKNVDITVPTVNDSTITVQKNGTTVDSFTLNQSSDKSINITVPTQASDVHALPDSTKYGARLSVSGTTVQLIDQNGNSLGDAITTQDTDTGATSVEVTGSGNAVTEASYSATNRKMTLTKGATYTTASDVGTLISGKQDAANNTNLTTTDKTIVGAINEVNSLAKGRVYTKEYDTISDMVTALNAMSATELKAGDNVYIVATGVPDLWVGKVESSATTYTYTTDSDFVNAITGSLSTTVQVGYYRLCELETEKVDLSNVVDSNSTISSSGSGNAVTGMSIDSNGNVTLTKGITAVETTRTIAGVDLEDDVTKSEMQTALDFDTKLDKITTSGLNRVYAITSEGQQGVFNVDDGLSNWSLVRRNGSGNVRVATTPINNNDATSKQYVDGKTPIQSISAGGTALTPDADKNVNIPIAGNSVKGVVDVRAFFGNGVDEYGRLYTVKATNQEIDEQSNDYKAIVPANLKYALSKFVLTGSGAPTTSTVGFIGQIYIDTTNNKLYICDGITEDTSTTPSTFTYTWVQMIRRTDTVAEGWTTTSAGLVRLFYEYGIMANSSGTLKIYGANTNAIDARNYTNYNTTQHCPITPLNLNYAVKAALTDANHLTMTSAEQATAQSVLGIEPVQYGLMRWDE